MTDAEHLAWGIALIVLAPALIAGAGFILAIAAAGAILLAFYGGRYGMRIYEQRNVGAKSRQDLNQLVSGTDDDNRWRRK